MRAANAGAFPPFPLRSGAHRLLVERLLAELASQTKRPRGVVLALDGYGRSAPPESPLQVLSSEATEAPRGPGRSWLLAEEALAAGVLFEDDLVVRFDDKIVLNRCRAVEALAAAAAETGASAKWGLLPGGSRAEMSDQPAAGRLVYAAAGTGFMVRAGLLRGLKKFADQVHKKTGGVHPLGPGGDDDALVSAWL